MTRASSPTLRPARSEVFSDAYLRLRDKFLRRRSGARADEAAVLRDAPALNEKALRALWYEGRFERRGLATLDGRRVGVVSPGEWNLDEGPDFRGAEVRLGEDVLRGDVEIHLRDRDWALHRHDRNPAYDGVVLHVFLKASRAPYAAATRAGNRPAAVCLDGRLPEPWSSLVQNFDAAGYPFNSHCGLGACGKKMSVSKFDVADALIRLAGDGRVLLKAARFDERAAPPDPAAALYGAVAEGLGYHRNKAPMAALVRRVPWTFLRESLARGAASDRRSVLEAVLFGAAGLLPEPAAAWDRETRDVLAGRLELWDTWRPALEAALGVPLSAAPLGWSTRGVRPMNSPERRLAALAVLLDRWLAAGRLDGLGRPDGPEAWSPEDFLVPPDGHFARRAKWGARPAARPAALVGPDRAQALWVNAFLPLAVRLCRRARAADAEARLHGAYQSLRLAEPNGPARLMAHRLFGAEKARRFPLRSEFQQQGLIQIFQDFCDTKPWACQACVFPDVLDLSIEELARGG